MLSGMSSVSPDGRYPSPFTLPDARSGAQLGALTGGRVGIAFNGVEMALLGLTIAIRANFAPKKGAEEVPLYTLITLGVTPPRTKDLVQFSNHQLLGHWARLAYPTAPLRFPKFGNCARFSPKPKMFLKSNLQI
ncbi:unnamed protein product [Chondrus crispus]|uniref:Uncharacterized protein n=1 Tax=Chondrus crispus TaxID=2769 RepID=R7QFQ5_CHOCR|nr:unnamed protein product [Chondrus crispus]CDF36583.1 unnamed protein product [Chondrus crispus]|eukprot:XP_005716402.1 unnamed protein product [Chondrus crispus]